MTRHTFLSVYSYIQGCYWTFGVVSDNQSTCRPQEDPLLNSIIINLSPKTQVSEMKKYIYIFIYFLGKLVSHNSIIFLHNFYLVQCTCSSAQRVSGFLQPLMNRLLTSSSDRTVFPPNASFNDPKTGCCVSDCWWLT